MNYEYKFTENFNKLYNLQKQEWSSQVERQVKEIQREVDNLERRAQVELQGLKDVVKLLGELKITTRKTLQAKGQRR